MTIYERVAALHNTTPEEVESEMRKVLEMARINMDPEEFIVNVAKYAKG